MFPHLLGMKEFYRLSGEDMGAVIGTSRQTYENKIRSGNFTPEECKAFCRRFGVGFDYLFSTIDEILRSVAIVGEPAADVREDEDRAGADDAGVDCAGADDENSDLSGDDEDDTDADCIGADDDEDDDHSSEQREAG